MVLLLEAPHILQRDNGAEGMAHGFALTMELKLWHMVVLLGVPHILQRENGSTTYLTA